LHKLWDKAKGNLITEESNITFLFKDGEENTAWHLAAYCGKLNVLEK
jgi:hypothetical protein